MHIALVQSEFEKKVCRNCNNDLQGKYCTHCGQKQQSRLSFSYAKDETWQLLRWFELDVLKQIVQTITQPGLCAFGFVSGQRKKFHHPLKLLLYCLGFYLIILDQTKFLQFDSGTQANQIALVVKKYAKWSFSLGIIAVVASTYISFFRKGGFNFVEHLALAFYIHCVTIIANGINLSISLIAKNATTIAALKEAATFYMGAIEVGVLLFAAWQFFMLPLKTDWWRYILLAGLYLIIKWGIVYTYAWLLLQGIKNNILT